MPSTTQTATGYDITIGSVNFKQDNPQGFQSMVFEDHVDMVSMLSVEVGGGESQPSWNFEIGQPVSAKFGGSQNAIFQGEVTAMEAAWDGGNHRIEVRALDKLHRLGRGRKTRTFLKKKDSDIASQIGGDAGLSVDVDSTSPSHDYVLQRNESDIAFLKRLAARNNYVLRVEGGSTPKLLFKKATFSGNPITLTQGTDIVSLRIGANTADLADKVSVHGWDMSKKQSITAQASPVTAVGGGGVGIQVALKAFGSQTVHITDVPVATQELAKAIADGELDRIARTFVRGTATLYGNYNVRAGTRVTLQGVNAPWSGTYVVMASRHVIDVGRGYTTEITLCSNSFGS